MQTVGGWHGGGDADRSPTFFIHSPLSLLKANLEGPCTNLSTYFYIIHFKPH